MGALGQLVVSLTANTASFQKEMSKAAMLADMKMKSMEGASRRASQVMGITLTAAATGFAIQMKRIIDDAAALGKTSQKIGMATEELSALRYAAQLADVDFDQLTKCLGKLSRIAYDAAGGLSAPRKVFESLGISVTNTDNSLRSIGDLLPEIADKFSKMADGTRKTALAQELFGKTGADLIPLLNEGSAGLEKMRAEAERLGIIISTGTAKQAEIFNDNLIRLKSQLSGMAINVANDVIPVLTDLSAIAAGNSQDLKGMDTAGQYLASTLILLVGAGGVITSSFKTMGIVIGDTLAILEASKRKDTFKAIPEMWRNMNKDIAATWNESNKDYMKLLDDEIARRAAIESGAADSTVESSRKVASARAEENRLMEEGLKLRESLRTPTEILNDTQEKLNELISSGAIDLETYNRAAAAAIKTYDEQIPLTKKSSDLMRDLGATFTSSAEEAILSGQKFHDVLMGLLEDIERIALRKMILEPLFNSLFSTDPKTGAGSGIISSIFNSQSTKSAKGNAFSSGRLLAYANGGVIGSRITFPMANGAVGMAGENGPEAIMPLKRTRSGDLGIQSDGGAGGVEINIYAPPGSEVSQERQMDGGMERINIMIDEAVAGNVGRAGSKTYKAIKSTFGVVQRLTNR